MKLPPTLEEVSALASLIIRTRFLFRSITSATLSSTAFLFPESCEEEEKAWTFAFMLAARTSCFACRFSAARASCFACRFSAALRRFSAARFSRHLLHFLYPTLAGDLHLV